MSHKFENKLKEQASSLGLEVGDYILHVIRKEVEDKKKKKGVDRLDNLSKVEK